MRRFLLPAAILAVVVVGYVLTTRADDAADPDAPDAVVTVDALTTPLLSVRRAPEWLRGPTTDRLLAAEVTAATAPLEVPGTTFCVAVDRNGGRALLTGTEGGNPRLIPGEIQRIVTIAAFVEQAAGTGFTTTVVRDAGEPDENGVVDGSLYLIGGADPVLSTGDFDPDRRAIAATSFEDLALATAAALREQGITGFTGGVIGDGTRHTPRQYDYVEAEVWSRSQYADSSIGPLSALLVNNGFDANGTRTDPTVDAAGRLQALLTFGGFGFGSGPADGVQPISAAAQEAVAEIASPAVSAIAARALVDPTTAEILYKELGVRGGSSGFSYGGLIATGAALADAGLVPVDDGLWAYDGSGLADGAVLAENANRVGCDHLVSILGQAIDDGPLAGLLPPLDGSPLAACLPPGADLRGLAVSRPGITGVAGVAAAGNGDELTFALLVNTADGATTDPCAGALPAVLQAIADHPLGPDLDEYSPLPVQAAPAAE